MDQPARSQSIVEDVFAATGKRMHPDDPLIVAALYYNRLMRESAEEVAQLIHAAAADLRAATEQTKGQVDATGAERAKLMREIERHVQKCAGAIIKSHSSQPDVRYIPAWYALVGAVVGAIVLTVALAIGLDRGSDLERDAAVGRTFSRILPTLDPQVKKQLIKSARNLQ